MKNLLLFIASVGAVLLLGCGEEDTELSPLKPESAQGNLLGEMKRLEVRNTPAAPQMPGIGSPTVTEVSYYRDLRLSKPITGTLEPGMTVYTKVVFSEPMRHIASDEKDARPILSFVIDGRAVRYRMKQRGTSGKKLQSGDSKPRNKKNDQFLCKYTVQADDEGPFTLKVGKFTTDTDGNKLAKTYVHGTVLQLGQQMPPEVTEVSYYRDLRLSKPITGTVKPGTTVYTKVVFSEPMWHIASDEKDARPILSFVIDGRAVRYRMKQRRTSGKNLQSGDSKPRNKKNDQFLCKYTVQADNEGSFTLKVGKASADANGNTLAEHYMHSQSLTIEAPRGQRFTGYVYVPSPLNKRSRSSVEPVAGATVTIMAGSGVGEKSITDHSGRYTFSNIEGDELHLLVEKERFEPKEVIVHRSRPTVLPNGIVPNFKEDPQKNPGTILIGHAWPRRPRLILDQILVVHDLLYVDGNALGAENPEFLGGFYVSGVVLIYYEDVFDFGGTPGILNIFAHEIAHAHQHAVVSVDGSGITRDWAETTPEGRAFKEARRKDWEEHGKSRYDTDPHFSSALENAAETCAYYLSLGLWWLPFHDDLKTSAPNRIKWAEEWLFK